MITKFKQQISLPYSLHDMVINNITLKNNSVNLEFEHGFTNSKEPYTQVDGKITIENVDINSACILLLSPLGKYGNFNGTKISLNNFIRKYSQYHFEIIDEMYEYNQIEYIGYLYLPQNNDPTQISLSMYYDGNIVYETEE